MQRSAEHLLHLKEGQTQGFRYLLRALSEGQASSVIDTEAEGQRIQGEGNYQCQQKKS